jgi:hypothetical protein
MALHLTKIAYGATSLDDLASWFDGASPEKRLRTRYRPTRHAELIGGSLYWIFQHAIVARARIIGFEQRAEDGHWDIVLENRLIPVHPQVKRAHQGWRYLTNGKAPADLAEGEVAGDALPVKMARDLSKLGLV